MVALSLPAATRVAAPHVRGSAHATTARRDRVACLISYCTTRHLRWSGTPTFPTFFATDALMRQPSRSKKTHRQREGPPSGLPVRRATVRDTAEQTHATRALPPHKRCVLPSSSLVSPPAQRACETAACVCFFALRQRVGMHTDAGRRVSRVDQFVAGMSEMESPQGCSQILIAATRKRSRSSRVRFCHIFRPPRWCFGQRRVF